MSNFFPMAPSPAPIVYSGSISQQSTGGLTPETARIVDSFLGFALVCAIMLFCLYKMVDIINKI